MRKSIFLLTLLSACTTALSPTPGAPARSVILFIGDGMGFSQVTLGRLAKGGPDAKLTLDECTTTGFVNTHSADQWVTDSAAAATALASGKKTENYSVGMALGGAKLESIVEVARDRRYAVGLVTTAKITHATPAPFAAHVKDRRDEADIAEQYLRSGVDVFLGGGAKFFPSAVAAKFSERGYHIVRTREEMWSCAATMILGLFADEHMPYVVDRPADCPTLAEMTKKAIGAMGGRPYFLMVEGARIDMACHAADAPSAAKEMIEFDDAVRAARETVGTDVLIVVTADHATNGLAVTEKAMVRWAAAAKVKASAEKIDALVRPDPLKNGDPAALRAALKEWTAIVDVTDAEAQAYVALNGPYDPAASIGEIISRRCGITWMPMDYNLLEPKVTHGHDGAMVPVYAWGPGAERFAGTLDNTEIPKRLRAALGWR